jgi:archaemetzincin
MRFTPPTLGQQIAAIASTCGLPEVLRRALDPGEEFQPLAEPGPSDWLANHPERGQTFEQFVSADPIRPLAQHRVLYLQPLGNFEDSEGPSLDCLRRFTTEFFEMDVRVLPALDLAQFQITSRRNPWTGQVQRLTTDILSLLVRLLPADAFILLGVTMTDLYPDESWNFVFGEAAPRDRVGVYSLCRYDPRFYGQGPAAESHKLILRRSCKVLAHEMGHLFGVEHCIWYRCLMNGSDHLAEADARPLHLCPVDLHKLQWSIGFDVLERYRRLKDFTSWPDLAMKPAGWKSGLLVLQGSLDGSKQNHRAGNDTSGFAVATLDHFDGAVAMAHDRVAHGAGQEMAMMMVSVHPNHYEIDVPRSGLFHNRNLWMSGYHFS